MSFFLLSTIIINNGISRYLIYPAPNLPTVFKSVNLRMNSHKHFLKDVIRNGCLAETAEDEAVQPGVIFLPNVFRTVHHRFSSSTLVLRRLAVLTGICEDS